MDAGVSEEQVREEGAAAVSGPRPIHGRGHLPAEGWGTVQAAEGRHGHQAAPPERTNGHCPVCGEHVLDGEAFCESCGADLVPEDDVTSPAPGVPVGAPLKQTEPDLDEPAPAARACTSCGGQIAPDGYCATCGAPAVSERDHWAEQPADWVGGVCDRGVRHHRNEDAMALAADANPGGLAVIVVCDGVSSAVDSDVASLAAARAARDVLVSGRTPTPSIAGKIQNWTRRLGAAAAAANEQATQVARHVKAAPPGSRQAALSPPSCTLVAAVVDGPVVTVGWIGDSRAYWLPDAGEPEQLSIDDSWATEQIAAGMPREQAEAAPQAHAITGWLGIDSPGDEPRCAAVTPTEPGWVLVCSDGLWNYCSPARDVRELVASVTARVGRDPKRIAAELVAWANGEGGHDNVTAALARITPEGKAD
jgi:serine/threonine protein phosphatase PrpC